MVNEQDKAILRMFADTPLLMDCVKRFILKHFTLEDLGTNYPDEMLGQLTRARLTGREKVETAFKDMLLYKSEPKQLINKNPAK